MESLIREGALRVLTSESTCDVILSCQGRRLMAHKVILSVASPIFRELFLDSTADPAVVILPDIPSHIMSLLLDYIYSGSVIVYSNTLHHFLSAAKLLQIKLDYNLRSEDSTQKIECNRTDEEEDPYDRRSTVDYSCRNDRKTKLLKKLPELIPITKIRRMEKFKNTRRPNCCLLPSPWRPRIETVFGNPRDDFVENSDYSVHLSVQQSKFFENDTNNNFQLQSFSRYHQHSRNALDLVEKASSNDQIRQAFQTSTVVSRPPEEVAIDRDKSTKIKPWLLKDASNPPRTFVPDVVNNLKSEESLERIKEEGSSNQIDENRFSNVKTEEQCIGASSECRGVDKEKPFKCKDCGKHFSQLRNFKYHRSVHEGTKEFAAKCSECGKVFNDKGYLSSHMKIHRDKKEYACPHCPKRFNQRVAYNMHLRIHTGIKPHECPTCGKCFSRKMLLKQHQRVHTGERPYSCPECGKTFADRSNMSLHARLHTGVKPYACSMCPKSFTKKHHLKTHMNFHTGLKPYTCQKCGLAFSQSSNMRTHYKKCMLKNRNSESETAAEEEENRREDP
ncbi:unnamed protein product [Phyllotreta striolata]|uniref:Uncharacterized protein n=1 Tax=Phyllotreta striolata TaxID=444603 RepID=A0A9N9XNL9_PHYSR|nr:unnamed protein product [Phyllotreta striolata]